MHIFKYFRALFRTNYEGENMTKIVAYCDRNTNLSTAVRYINDDFLVYAYNSDANIHGRQYGAAGHDD